MKIRFWSYFTLALCTVTIKIWLKIFSRLFKPSVLPPRLEKYMFSIPKLALKRIWVEESRTFGEIPYEKYVMCYVNT